MRSAIKVALTSSHYGPNRDGGCVLRGCTALGPWRACVAYLRCAGASSHLQQQTVMQFHIEITCETDICSKVIYRATIDEITAVRAKTKAAALLDLYAGRGANSARVLNPKNEVIFRL
jgi:hypothetical protein